MIAYEKKNKKARRRFGVSIGILILLIGGMAIYPWLSPKQELPVFNEFPVLKLPDKKEEKESLKVVLPYKEGKKVVDYFTGESGKVVSIVEFEGIYRPSQGVDISNNGESFEVLSAMEGVVVDVMKDAMLGNGIRIQSGKFIITYQSLDKIQLKKGDAVKQNDLIGFASTNMYQASLKNHLHLVVEQDGVRIDPNSIFKFE